MSERSTRMIVTGHLMLADRPLTDGRVRLAAGWLRIEGSRIVEVVEGEMAERYDFGGPDCLITPGLIDAHVHLPQFDIIGAHGMPLLDWLEQVTFPAENRWANPQYAAEMTDGVIDQLFAVGTTAIGGYASVHHAATRAALECASHRGMRGVIGQVLMDRHGPEAWLRPAEQQIRETASLLDDYPPGKRLGTAITPRFAVACSESLLEQAGVLAKQSTAIVQTHLSETQKECEVVRRDFGRSYVDVYHDCGLLSPRSVLGHGVHLSDTERKVLQRTGSVVAHCPTANSFLQSGTMDRQRLDQAGVRIAVGSDIGAGYERSMVRVARAMIEAAASIGDAYPSANRAWWQITYGNALAFDWPDADRFSNGSAADVLVIEPPKGWLAGSPDPLGRLMFGWDDRWLTQTLVRGRLAFDR